MKNTLLFLCMTLLLSFSIRAEEEFPALGSSYRIFYTKKPNIAFCPDVVKILKKGSSGWALVEAEKEPGSKPVSFWLNFDQILSASEITQAENSAGQASSVSVSELEKAITKQESKVESLRKALTAIAPHIQPENGKLENSNSEAIKNLPELQNYVDVKRELETAQEILRLMKLKLTEEKREE